MALKICVSLIPSEESGKRERKEKKRKKESSRGGNTAVGNDGGKQMQLISNIYSIDNSLS